MTYHYDPANLLSFLAEPGGSCPTTSYASPNSTKCTHFTYTDDNQREWVYYPNGQKIHLQYTPAGQLKQLDAATSGGGVLASRGYTYSKAGADAGLRDSVTDGVAGTTTNYSYDGMSRLTAANNDTTAWSYSYDKAGNRLTSAKTGEASTYAGYNDADELCWTGTAFGTCTPMRPSLSHRSNRAAVEVVRSKRAPAVGIFCCGADFGDDSSDIEPFGGAGVGAGFFVTRPSVGCPSLGKGIR